MFPFTIETNTIDGVIKLDCIAKRLVPGPEREIFQKAHEALADSTINKVVIDLRVDYIDSKAIGQLFRLGIDARERNKDIWLICRVKRILELFNHMRLGTIIAIFQTEEEVKKISAAAGS